MGCWNETCMLTRLPIHGGDKAVCVILLNRPGRVDTCRADGSYLPVAEPIFGTYDEYGSLEDIEKPDAAADGLLRIDAFRRTPDGGKATLAAIGTRDPREIISALGHDAYFVEQSLYDGRRVDARIFPVFMSRQFYDMALDMITSGPCPDDDKFLWAITADTHFGTPVRKAVREGTADMDLLGQLWRLGVFMERMRIAWGPTAGSGSQSTVEKDQIRFYQAMADAANRIMDKYKDPDDED